MRNVYKAINNYNAFIDTEFLPIQCSLTSDELNYFFNQFGTVISGGGTTSQALYETLTDMFRFAYYSGMKYGQKTMKKGGKKNG